MILNGWKEIAGYVKSSVRTVQRWEKMGMPVGRPLPTSRGSVIAYSEQLDLWLARSQDRPQPLGANGMHDTNFYERLMEAQSLTRQLRETKTEMETRMTMLKAQVALLRENMLRLKLVGDRSSDGRLTASRSAAPEISASSAGQKLPQQFNASHSRQLSFLPDNRSPLCGKYEFRMK